MHSPYTERNTAILVGAAEGKSLTTLATHYGISRERVRQLVKRAGFKSRWQETRLKHRRRAINLKVLNGARSIQEIAQSLGHSQGTVSRELSAEQRRILTSLRKPTKDELLHALRNAEWGTWPKARDAMTCTGHSWNTYAKYFGSWLKACRLAGLIPSPRGRSGTAHRKAMRAQKRA